MLRRRAEGALSGMLAAFSGVGAAEGVATLIGGPSPVVAVGTWAIDTSPKGVREWAIENFGVNDKHVLVSGMLVTIALLGALAGAIGVTRRREAIALSAGVGLVGLLAVSTVRGVHDTAPVRVTPAFVALLVSTAALWRLLEEMERSTSALEPEPELATVGATSSARVAERTEPAPSLIYPERPRIYVPPGLDRRGFLRVAGVVGAVGVAGGTAWKLGEQGGNATTDLLSLPKPASPGPVVRNADFGIPGLTPYFTPNDEFYRIDTALVVPRIDHENWRLKIHGMVDKPITLTYADLLKAKLIERDVTLMCVSNEVGGDLNGNARWLGVRIADVLASVGVQPGADAVKTTSDDGWTCGTPLSALTDPGRDAMFAIGMNGEPLPYDHGFPVRMVVPGLYGFVSATKWITEFEVTRFDEFEAYWTSRGWSAQAPVKTQSRIDIPTPYRDLAPGAATLGGVAWAQHRGISKVEVLIDDEVRVAELAPWDNKDTWRQWRVPNWKPKPGNRIVAVRATDGTGAVQTDKHSRPDPDGATGYDTVTYPVS